MSELLWTVPVVLETDRSFAELFDPPTVSMPRTEAFCCGGIPIEGQREPDALVVRRVLSTDPADFLRLSPGQRIPLMHDTGGSDP